MVAVAFYHFCTSVQQLQGKLCHLHGNEFLLHVNIVTKVDPQRFFFFCGLCFLQWFPNCHKLLFFILRHDMTVLNFFQCNLKWQVSSRMTSTQSKLQLVFERFFLGLFLHERNSYSVDVGYLTYAFAFLMAQCTLLALIWKFYRLFCEVTFKFLYKYENYLGSFLDYCSSNISFWNTFEYWFLFLFVIFEIGHIFLTE